jgi:hypothetical protein
MKKSGWSNKTKALRKVGKVMHEFKEGTLHSGKSDKVVKNPKQAIAIALSEAGLSKKAKGGSLNVGDTFYRAWFTDSDGEKHSAIIVAKTKEQAEKTAEKIDSENFS